MKRGGNILNGLSKSDGKNKTLHEIGINIKIKFVTQ